MYTIEIGKINLIQIQYKLCFCVEESEEESNHLRAWRYNKIPHQYSKSSASIVQPHYHINSYVTNSFNIPRDPLGGDPSAFSGLSTPSGSFRPRAYCQVLLHVNVSIGGGGQEHRAQAAQAVPVGARVSQTVP